MIGQPVRDLERLSAPALPTGVRVFDLEAPENALPVRLADGRPCRSVIGLVRAGQRPLATVTLALDEHGDASPAQLRAALDQFEGRGEPGHTLERTGAADPTGPGEPGHTLERAGAPNPTITIVIATCAQPARVVRCLLSLLATGYEALEIIVVENRPQGSRTRQAICDSFPADERIRVIDAHLPGLSHARNAGLVAARGEIVAFLDDDVVVDRSWASALARAFDDPKVDCVTGLILPATLETVEQLQFEQLAGFGKGLLRRSYLISGGSRYGPLFPYAAGAFGSGSNTALRTSVARELRGFDERLGTGTAARGGEDLDLYVRLLQAGHRLDYDPAAIVFHQHPSDAHALRSRAFGYGVGLTAMLTRRWLTGASRRELFAAIPAGIRHLLDPDSRKNELRTPSYPRRLVWLERLGMAAGPAALVLSLCHRGRNQSRPTPKFSPGATAVVDLEQPLADLDLGRTPDGECYGSVLVLVRLHGDPLTVVEVPLVLGRSEAGALAEHLWVKAGAEVKAHVNAQRCLDPASITPESLAAGLAAPACPGAGAAPAGAGAADARPQLPFVSVVVPTARRPQRIRGCVSSLAAMDYPAFEIVVVDNAPDDPSTREAVQACADEGFPVRYLAEPLPGSSVARNRGVRETDADLIAFTDDDVTVEPDWLKWMISPFLEDEATGVVTGLVMPARLDTREQRRFEELSGFGKGFERSVYDTGSNLAPGRLLYPYWGAVFGSGNSMAFRRRVYEDLGGLDPALGAGSPAKAGADIESFSHAIIRGSRLVYEPRAICWHDHRATEDGLRRQTFNYGVGCTAILTKWSLRDARLRALIAREGRAFVRRSLRRGLRGRGPTTRPPHELARLKSQMAIHRQSGMLIRQFAGFALGPLMYARSVVWARRLRLRSVLPPTGSGHG